MRMLRNARLVTRLVLVWFALYLGAAAASPLLAPRGYELICSGAGMAKLLVKVDDGSPGTHDRSAMDCPLCAPGGVPPAPPMSVWTAQARPLAYATRPLPAARIAALVAAPLPARGPPAAS